ncbi:uncharacterized protein LOC143041712 [Oratosquilla oratoria]|uniref:uncharacterized protein LOC143041712 n=1 Tax=Oratosquilla oratoria TaxID=337810 RepID=UPI003F76F9CC
MYMATRANLDYWATDNCCYRWSLRKGSAMIGVFSMVCHSGCVALAVQTVVRCQQIPPANCSLLPLPERRAMARAELDSFQGLAISATVAAYFCIYLLLSFCVVVGVATKAPRLLSGWVYWTCLHMALLMIDLVFTLAHTTLLHLSILFANFLLALCTWAVMKSHVRQLWVERNTLRAREAKRKNPDLECLDISDFAID